MRPVVFSGFDVTDALWKYLEVGHNIDPRPVYKFIPGFEDCLDEGDDDPELAEMTNRRPPARPCRSLGGVAGGALSPRAPCGRPRARRRRLVERRVHHTPGKRT